MKKFGVALTSAANPSSERRAASCEGSWKIFTMRNVCPSLRRRSTMPSVSHRWSRAVASGAARQLEDIAGGRCVHQRRFDGRDLVEPRSPMLLAAVVAALAEEPLVVLGCPRPVVGDLLVENAVLAVSHGLGFTIP